MFIRYLCRLSMTWHLKNVLLWDSVLFSAYNLKHARDLVRAITKKVKTQPPATSQIPLRKSQPALPMLTGGHVPLMLPPIRKGAMS